MQAKAVEPPSDRFGLVVGVAFVPAAGQHEEGGRSIGAGRVKRHEGHGYRYVAAIVRILSASTAE